MFQWLPTPVSLLSLLAVLTLGLAGPTAADAAVISVGASKDNTLFENAGGSLSNGSGIYLFAGRTNQPAGSALRRGLIAFDVAAAVPAGSTIDAVSLDMTLSKTRTAIPRAVGLHRATADWGEGASNATGQEGSGTAAQAGDATWLHTFSPGSLWTTAGGDFAGAASATTNVAGNGVYTWASTAQLVADVQSWLDTPAGNFGWVVVGDESTNTTAKRFNSRENNGGNPALTITYTIPTPATASLLLLGLPALWRRAARRS